jgi:hypothetical protein
MQEQDSNLFSDVTIDETAKRNIAGIASWAMVIVVVAVIGYVLDIVGLFTKEADVVEQSGGLRSALTMGGGDAVGVVIGIIVGVLINYFLYRFATLSRSSLSSHSQPELADSFRNLRIYFAITTVIMIIGLLFILLGMAALL